MKDGEVIAVGWIAICAIAFIASLQLSARSVRFSRVPVFRGPVPMWLILIALAFIIRLVPTLLLVHTNIYDLESYRIVAAAFERGKDIYQDPGIASRHPYFPFQLYLIVASDKAGEFLGLPFNLLVRLPPLVADVGIVALIHALERRGLSEFKGASIAYAFNPISLSVIALGAQFDSIPIFLVLLAAAALLTRPTRIGAIGSALLMGFAIADKTWPLLVLVPLAAMYPRPLRSALYLLVALLVPLAAAVVYSAQWGTPLVSLVKMPLEYKGVGGRWGFEALLSQVNLHFPNLRDFIRSASGSAGELFVGGLLVVYLQGLSWPSPWRRLVAVFLTVFTAMSGFGLQYFSWIVPFALLANSRHGLTLFVALAGAGMTFMYLMEVFPAVRGGSDIGLSYQLSLLPVWFVCAAWWLWELRPTSWRSPAGASVAFEIAATDIRPETPLPAVQEIAR